jgi:formate dehydrogenase maturation protein FdhE
VPENGRTNAVVDACRRCRGYVKTLTRLQGSPPAGVHLDDLATVELDIAALEQRYERPGGTGYPLSVTLG